MCEGVAYLVRDGSEEEILREVVSIRASGDSVTLVSEDGEVRELSGVTEVRVDMVRHVVWILAGPGAG